MDIMPSWEGICDGLYSDETVLDIESTTISATLTNIDKFDSGAFRVHSRMAATLDPQCRLMLEVGYLQ